MPAKPTWGGQGWRDGAQDARLFRAAVLLAIRAALSEARTIADAAANEKLAKHAEGASGRGAVTTWRRLRGLGGPGATGGL